jgi:hypothetical protein
VGGEEVVGLAGRAPDGPWLKVVSVASGEVLHSEVAASWPNKVDPAPGVPVASAFFDTFRKKDGSDGFRYGPDCSWRAWLHTPH